jgi:hypothetical protein
MTGMADRRAAFGVDRLLAHQLQQPLDAFAIHRIAKPAQMGRHP